MTDVEVAVVAFACFLGGVLTGIFTGAFFESRLWRKDAVRRDVARYNGTTGKWGWTVEKSDD